MDLWQRIYLPPRSIARAAAMAAIAVVILGSIYLALGKPATLAAYFGIMLLLSPAKNLPLRSQILAGTWAFVVAMSGYFIGEHRDQKGGLLLLAAGLFVVCVVQAFFRVGHNATVARSPVNLLLFAAMPATGAQTWHVVVGTAIGVVLVFGAMRLLPKKPPAQDTSAPDTSAQQTSSVVDEVDNADETVAQRLRAGLTLATGCLFLVLIGELIPSGLPRVQWSLLALCLLLAVDTTQRNTRMKERIIGTFIGALAATFASMLPMPVPYVLAAVCAILCLAYILAGDYTLFIVFLTPAVLLTSGGKAPWSLALENVEAVLIAVILALFLTSVSGWIDARRDARPPRRLERHNG